MLDLTQQVLKACNPQPPPDVESVPFLSCLLRIPKKLVNIALVQEFSVSVIFVRSDTFHHEGCRMHNVYQYPEFLYSEEIPAATFLVVAIKNIFRRWQMSSGWQNHPELGITALSL